MCAVCLLFTGLPAQAETAELKVSLPDTVKGYTLCEIVIESPLHLLTEDHINYNSVMNI